MNTIEIFRKELDFRSLNIVTHMYATSKKAVELKWVVVYQIAS